jgi:N-acetylmuramoyl-L-alanine amidase
MSGFRHFSLTAAALAALLLWAVPAAEAGPRPGAPGTAASAYTQIGGVSYVDVRVFLARFGFRATWVERGKIMRLQSSAGRLDIQDEKRDVQLNGMRVLMGEPAVATGGSLYISRIDAEKLFRPILSPSSVTTPPAPEVRVIVIDAGHGGQDTGTQNKALKLDEKNFALDVSMRLRSLLVKQGYRVVMTRTDDRFVELPRRAEIANKAGADLFISVHFNAVAGSPSVRGSETYVMTPQYQRSTGSPRRDRSDNVANLGNRNDPWNALLGYHIHAQVLEQLRSEDRGFKRARFAVLRLVNCPAVLVEAGYLSNNDEARRIATPAYRQALAEAISRGVRDYALAITTARTR